MKLSEKLESNRLQFREKHSHSKHMKQTKKKKLNNVLNVYIGIGITLWVVAAGLILLPLAPTIIYTVMPGLVDNEKESITKGIEQDEITFADLRAEYLTDDEDDTPKPDPLPKFDPTLPVENMIIIPGLDVNAVIQQGDNPDLALNNGPWLVNTFGTPEENEFPIIIPSHRWGVIGWTNLERRERSFVRLPELDQGETVEIIWNQRKYIYEVYKAENNTEINDYDADLILYTCQFYWPSDERIFRYAMRVN